MPGNRLAWAREGQLFVGRLDSASGRVSDAVAALTDLNVDAFSGNPRFDVSPNGTLVYVAGEPDGRLRELVVADGTTMTPLPIQPRMFEQPSFAPDGKRFVVRTMEGGENSGLWTGEIGRTALMRLTMTNIGPESPIWSPDGERIAFVAGATSDGKQWVFIKRADDAGATTPVWQSPNHSHVGDWSPDGSTLAMMVSDPTSLGDLWIVPVAGGSPSPWLNTPASEREPRFSPDGRWLAYTSNESGRDEVYVRPYPGPGGKVQVSTNGGGQPLWSKHGAAIIYRHEQSFMRADVQPTPAFTVAQPTLLLSGDFDSGPVAGQTSYAASPVGDQLLLVRPVASPVTSSLRVILNWPTLLAQSK